MTRLWCGLELASTKHDAGPAACYEAHAMTGTEAATQGPGARRKWTEILFTRKMLTCIFLGFSSGMPLYVLISLVPAWLRSNHVDLATIGLFALVGLPYTWKFVWSPLMDRFTPPFLGRRRGWAVLT